MSVGEGEYITGTSTNISARTVNNFYQLSLEFMLSSLPAWQCTLGTWKSMYRTPPEDASPQIAFASVFLLKELHSGSQIGKRKEMRSDHNLKLETAQSLKRKEIQYSETQQHQVSHYRSLCPSGVSRHHV